MEFLTKVIGFKEKEKAQELKYGQMDPNMSVNGKVIRPMDKELFITQMVIFMKVNGSMIKHVVRELTLTKMVPSTSDNGKMTNKTDTVLNNGSMDKSMKGSIKTELKLVKESSNLSIKATMKDNF